MQNTLIDNSDQFRLVDYLNDLAKDTKCNEICIATGYWDLKGTKLLYDALLPFFERGGKMRLLIGEEPTVRSYQLQTDIPKEEKFPDFYIQRDVNQLTEEYAPVAQMLLQYSNIDEQDNSQIQIRVYGQKGEEKKFLHAKCYIFLGEGQAYGILGSSNFTERGLQDNAELNHLETNPNSVTGSLSQYNPYKTHLVWFNDMWNDKSCEEWTGKFIKDILQKAPVAKAPVAKPEPEKPVNTPLTPYEAYIRLLSDRFGKLVDDDMEAVLSSYLPAGINQFKFQMDAATLCTQVMHQHGGFMLGDVVGLGKTIVGVLVLKYYLDTAADEGRAQKALIIVPPAIKSGWEKTIHTFDEGRDDKIAPYVDFITTGSINKLMEGADDVDEDTGEFEGELQHAVYGLIMIDESHNFRNRSTQKYEMLENLIEEINLQAGYYPYIGLLSATFQNNSPEDLKNQIYLFQRRPRESTLAVEGHNLEYFFTQACNRYEQIIHEKPLSETEKKVNRDALIFLSQEIHNKVLAELLVRRTRADIKHDYKENLHFPDVKGPIPLEYKMNLRLAQLFYDSMRYIAPDKEDIKNGEPGIVYMRYRATEYLTDELKKRYSGKNMTPEKSASRLARIMQMLLVKRLESSFTAFRESLENLQRYTRNMINMWEDNCIFICPQIDVNAELNLAEKRRKTGNLNYTIQQCYDDIRKKIEKLTKEGRNAKKQNAEYKRSDFDATYYDLLVEDIRYIDELVNRWKDERTDPKLDEFKDAIRHTLFNPETNTPQKLVVFSEAIATVDEIVDVLKDAGKRVLKITAANRDERETAIRANFDANYDGEWANDYDAIVTTEVLAEGVNLHRANTILNYDTPWNSTRLIQRIGRVNRIGSVVDKVYVYNFFPSTQGDETINLTQRAFTKLQSFHTLFGEDNRIFMEEEELSQVDYMKLMDGQETPYTKYIAELQEYKQTHPDRFEQICLIEAPICSSFRAADKESLFVVKTDINNAGSVYVRIAGDEGTIIPCLDMFQLCACAPETESVIIELNPELEKQALLAYNTHVAKIYRAATTNNKHITKAKSFIREIVGQSGLTKEAKQRLNIASKIMGKGDVALARKVCKLADQYHDIQLSLFETTMEDKMARVSGIIEEELKALNRKMIERNGEPYIYFCTNKVNN